MDRTDRLFSILKEHTQHADRLEFTQTELTDPHCWENAMQGCSGVLHIASPAPVIQPKDPDEIIRPARQGTLNILTAAKNLNITRVVLTSSVSAVWGGSNGGSRLYSESDWTDTDAPSLSPYILSKTFAEQAAWEFVKQHRGPELTVINPSFVLGPALEKDYGSSLELIRKFLKGQFPLVPKLGFEVVDVRDVAILHRLAFESSESSGRRFLCSSGFRWLKEMSNYLREKFPDYRKRLSTRDMPNFLLKVVSFLDGSVTQFLPDIELKKEMDTSPARDLLGWTPRSPEEAIESGARSLIALGIV
jgi:nucleoside-diphosphate-sugar epimerase